MMMCIRRIRCGVMLMGMMRMTLCEKGCLDQRREEK